MKSLILSINQLHFISKEQISEYAPHIILKVGIIPFKAPTFTCWWKCTEHQQFCIARQPRFKRMFFYQLACSLTRYTHTGKWSEYPSSHTPPALVRFGLPLYCPSRSEERRVGKECRSRW